MNEEELEKIGLFKQGEKSFYGNFYKKDNLTFLNLAPNIWVIQRHTEDYHATVFNGTLDTIEELITVIKQVSY